MNKADQDKIAKALQAPHHVRKSATNENVHFRFLQTPCCTTLLCWVNPRFPNYCPECGKFIAQEIKGCVLTSDPEATIRYTL